MPATNTNIHGRHQEIHYGAWRTNKFGVLSGIIERHKHGEKQNEPDWKLMLPRSAPESPVPCVGVQREFDAALLMGRYIYTYDGLLDDDTSFEDRIYCSCDGTDSEEPIETHPQFKNLFEKYKGKKDAQGRFSHFSQFLTDGGEKKFNPLYGVTGFLSFTMIWTRTYVLRSLPSYIFANVDSIDRPRGHKGMQPPSLRGKRNWIKLAPVAQQRENYVTIAERWMASGRNGWNPDVYSNKTSLGGGAGESGLTSGGLVTGSL